MRYFFLITIISLGLLYAADVHAGIIFRPVFHTGLVGYWDFQEGAGSKSYDKSGNENHGTLENMATSSNGGWTDGKLGSGLDFDGIDDYVALPTNAGFINGDFTVVTWAKTDDLNDQRQSMVCTGNSVTPWEGWCFSLNVDAIDRLSFWHSDGITKTWEHSPHGITDNEFHHFAAVWNNGDEEVTFYIDGGFIETHSAGPINYDNGDFTRIGSSQFLGQYFNGLIDEVRIYDRALSAGEVERLYKLSQPTVAAPTMTGLVGYWRFDEGKGAKARDYSFNTNHGDLQNMEETDWVDGKLGTALDFDGSDYISIPDSASLRVQNLTISAWINSIVVAYSDTIIDKRDSGNLDSYVLKIWNNQQIRFCIEPAAEQSCLITTASAVSSGVWTHITATWDGTTIRIYKDGVVDPTTEGHTAAIAYQAYPVLIGVEDQSGDLQNGFAGIIDEVRIYNRALEANEIEALYKSGLAKINASQNDKLTDGLVGLWSFNGPDMDGDDAFDRSGQNNHGILQNGPVPTIGKVGQALEFSGSNDYVEIDDVANSNVMTWSFWINAPSGETIRRLLDKYKTVSSGREWRIFLDGDDIDFQISSTGDNQEQRQATFNIAWGVWTHVTVVYNEGIFDVYKNGAVVSDEGDFTLTFIHDSGTSFWIGDGHVTNPFNGLIDEVRIYNRALSAEEIRRLYNMGR